MYRESFALVKGAVLHLEDGERTDEPKETSQLASPSSKQGNTASVTKNKHLHAMLEQLRPEDTIKLVRCLSQAATLIVKA